MTNLRLVALVLALMPFAASHVNAESAGLTGCVETPHEAEYRDDYLQAVHLLIIPGTFFELWDFYMWLEQSDIGVAFHVFRVEERTYAEGGEALYRGTHASLLDCNVFLRVDCIAEWAIDGMLDSERLMDCVTA